MSSYNQLHNPYIRQGPYQSPYSSYQPPYMYSTLPITYQSAYTNTIQQSGLYKNNHIAQTPQNTSNNNTLQSNSNNSAHVITPVFIPSNHVCDTT